MAVKQHWPELPQAEPAQAAQPLPGPLELKQPDAEELRSPGAELLPLVPEAAVELQEVLAE